MKALWIGGFQFANTVTPVGNCIVACDRIGNVGSAGKINLPTIIATRDPVVGPVLGQWIQGYRVQDIETQARLSKHRPIVYWDSSRRWPRRPELPANSWLCIKGYCLKQETLAAFEEDLRACISEQGDMLVALVCQAYTSNDSLIHNIAALVPIYERLAQLPNVVALLLFSDTGRVGGLQDHLDVKFFWRQLARGFNTPTLMNTPKFTIASPTFPVTATATGIYALRCERSLEDGSGPLDWIEWQYSAFSKDGPWTKVRNVGDDPDHTFKLQSPGTYWIKARAGNSAGEHETLLERRVVLTLPVSPPEPPPVIPPVQQGIPFLTVDGHYLSLGPGGIIEAKATSDEDVTLARFVLEVRGTQWALKVGDKYVNADMGGGGHLYANRDKDFEDEHFTITQVDGGFTIATRNGKLVHAEFGGGGRVLATKDRPGLHETFQAPLFQNTLPALRKQDGRFRTDEDWFVPRCYSVFHALALVRDGNITELRRLLQRAKDARCNMVRIFGGWHYIGGGLAPFSQADPEWQSWMGILIEEAEAMGLYIALSYFCDAQVLVPVTTTRIQLFSDLAVYLKDKPGVIVTVANEARKNGWPEADDPTLLDLVRLFKGINPLTLIGASDPLDAGVDGTSAEDYNRRQKNIAASGVDFLLVHPDRKARFEWVSHLYGAAQTPGAVGFDGRCWIEEPMGGAGVDVPGRRDSSMVAHVAAALVGAMVGAYTYMHRQLESDVCPGLQESAIAADIAGSPDYRFINATLAGSPVAQFSKFDKCRTISNGTHGWAVAYGAQSGELEYAAGWHEIARQQWRDGTGTCIFTEVSR